MKMSFGGRVLILGCGSVSRCLQPLILQNFEMDFSRLTILDSENLRHLIPDTLEAGAHYVQIRITPDNLASTLSQYVGAGDVLIDLAWNIDAVEIIQWCHDHDVLYINTSVEVWDPYADIETAKPTDRTLYVRHMALRERAGSWAGGATAVVEHGANPGLVSHWTKVALEHITCEMLRNPLGPILRHSLESALSAQDFAGLAMLTGVKVIHISERDTQITNRPKQVNEFVNTWSVQGFYEEGIAPAEMGWGTHERRLPKNAHTYDYGPQNQICLGRIGMETYVRSWIPMGEIIGMVVRHGEAFTICDHLTVWDDEAAIYRPTVHYAYLPTDAAMNSVHELKMRNFALQPNERIMTDEIIEGRDELGVLLLGHALNGWWVGSSLDIHTARELAPGQNATTLQVAASVLGAIQWMIKNPNQGLCVPDDLPYQEILAVANPYLGECISTQTDWTPAKNRHSLQRADNHADNWQFESFLV